MRALYGLIMLLLGLIFVVAGLALLGHVVWFAILAAFSGLTSFIECAVAGVVALFLGVLCNRVSSAQYFALKAEGKIE